ncbi:MAG: hypothetical protein UCH28_06100, partial [Adlercreutzia sp.]|nr:hypothetical protein [Adlercreutzia sp.]
KIRVSMRSHIFGNNESEKWYDRILTAPWDNTAQTNYLENGGVDSATTGAGLVERPDEPDTTTPAMPQGGYYADGTTFYKYDESLRGKPVSLTSALAEDGKPEAMPFVSTVTLPSGGTEETTINPDGSRTKRAFDKHGTQTSETTEEYSTSFGYYMCDGFYPVPTEYVATFVGKLYDGTADENGSIPGTIVTPWTADTAEEDLDQTSGIAEFAYVLSDGSYLMVNVLSYEGELRYKYTDSRLNGPESTDGSNAGAGSSLDDKEPFNSSAYYQIYDVDHFEGNAANSGRRENVQPYGMDYTWTLISHSHVGAHAPQYGQFYGSYNMPAINGYTIQNNTVMTEADLAGDNAELASLANMGLKVTNNGTDGTDGQVKWNEALKDGKTIYAQTGSYAIQRKPVVRVWNTVTPYEVTPNTSSHPESLKNETYYVDTEADVRQINVHVENRDWLAEQPYSWHSKSYGTWKNGSGMWSSEYRNNYSTDGGQKGSLPLPVVTVVLPYGVAPYNKTTGQPYATGTPDEDTALYPTTVIDPQDWDISYTVGANIDNMDNVGNATQLVPTNADEIAAAEEHNANLAEGEEAVAVPEPVYSQEDLTGYRVMNGVNENLTNEWKQANFRVTVTYEMVTTNADVDGLCQSEMRYVVRFEPIADGYNDARDLITQIVNGGMDIFKMNVVTYDEPKRDKDEPA